MAFTRRHYEVVGDIIARSGDEQLRSMLEESFSDMFDKDNPLYKRELFQRRCNVEVTKEKREGSYLKDGVYYSADGTALMDWNL